MSDTFLACCNRQISEMEKFSDPIGAIEQFFRLHCDTDEKKHTLVLALAAEIHTKTVVAQHRERKSGARA